MQYLKADTAVKVVIGPVVAVGDGYVPVTTLSLSTADEAEIMKHDAAAVTSISGNTFAAITSADGYYNLTITAAQLDTEGMLTVLINDDSLCLPVRHDFMVVSANVYDSLFAAAATDYLQVDTIQVGGATEDIATETKQDIIDTNVDAILVDTAEIGAAGAGLTALAQASVATEARLAELDAANIPADVDTLLALIGNIATGSSAVSIIAESQVLTTGTEVNTYASTATKDGVYHEITDAAGAMELYYQFDVGSDGVAAECSMWGRLFSSNDTIGVYAWNWATSAWDQIGELDGSAASSDVFVSFNLLVPHTGTGANLGKVRVRGYAASGLTSATLYLDQVYVSYAVIPVSRQTKGSVVDVSPAAAGFDTDLTEADTHWDDALLIFTSGTLLNQARSISSSLAASGALTFDEAFRAAPANGDTFIIYHTHIHPVNQIRDAILADSTPFNGADIPAILADTADMQPKLGAPAGASMSADIAAVQADTDAIEIDTQDIQSRLPAALVGGKISADAVAVGGSTDGATRLGKATQANVYGTVGAASTTTNIVTSALDPAAAATDQFKGKIVTFDANTTTAALRGQSTDITASTAGGALTVTALTTAPVSGDTFVIT